jgi:hypothetical protein
MGLESFDLPCGSAADVAELEYIAALHQTGESMRLDGSIKGTFVRRRHNANQKKVQSWRQQESSPPHISYHLARLLPPIFYIFDYVACDIRLYLSSRYGITVTEEQVKDIVLFGLGADTNDVLDLAEIVACLLMPTLLKVKNQQVGNPLPHFVVPADKDLFEKILETIQRDVLLGVS